MAEVLSLNPLGLRSSDLTRPKPHRLLCSGLIRHNSGTRCWTHLIQGRKSTGKVYCLFSGNRKQEQAKKALEGALGGKKHEFDKWNKEIKRREDAGGGGVRGGGGSFGWGGRFGWSSGDHFWEEVKQMILTILGLVIVYLMVAKGDTMLAVIFNPLVNALRGTREGLSYLASRILRLGRKIPNGTKIDFTAKKDTYTEISAKERVLRKWGSG